MTEQTLQHTHLDGISDYTAALDTLCQLTRRNLYLYERDFEGLGFNSEARYETLRHFLLANPANRLYLLAHDARYLSAFCARMNMLLRQFDSRMAIHRIPQNLASDTEPFSVADATHFVRRFHFNDPRGILALNDPETARMLQLRFLEMWSRSQPAVSATTLGL